MNKIYDICIAGAGISGIFAAYRLAEKNKNKKIILVDLGRPQGKRRRQTDGFLGCLPNSDGKLYLSDIDKVSELVGNKKAKKAAKYVKSILKQFSDCKVIKDKGPNQSIKKKLNDNNYDINLNSYFQLYPQNIHSLAKYMSDTIEKSGNIEFSFDNEITSITKNKNIFTIETDIEEIKCKKVVFCVGRGGWRFAHNIFKTFDLIETNDLIKFGVRVEMPTSYLKDFNKSTCSISKNGLEIGPLSWGGCVIPEDHVDMAISAFRGNENRWKTDKVSFQLINNIYDKNNGVEQTNRIANLTYLLSNDRILKEKASLMINKRSKMSIMSEYNWVANSLKELSNIIPEVLTKAYIHIPTIIPLPAQINLGTNLSTELEGFYVAGESSGIIGIYAAAMMGTMVADSVSRG